MIKLESKTKINEQEQLSFAELTRRVVPRTLCPIQERGTDYGGRAEHAVAVQISK